MGSYKLSEVAKVDLTRIYRHGLRSFGEEQADAYFYAFIERFQEIADAPTRYPEVNEIREGYRRSVCGMDSIFYRISDDNTVEIMSIIGRQDADSWL